MKYLLVTLSASLLLSVAATAGPVITFTYVSNLASSDNTTFLVSNTDLATSFTMGGASSTRYAAGLLLDGVSSSGIVHPNISAGYNAYIYSDASGSPGIVLYTFTTEYNASPKALVTFPAPANSTLAADTTYWLVLKTLGTGYPGTWEATTVDSSTSPNDWTIPGGEKSLLSGTSANTPLFQIVVTPEPGTLALASLGGLGLTLFRRRA